MKTLAEVNKKNKNLGLPFRSEEKSPLFLSAKARGGSAYYRRRFTVAEKILICGTCRKRKKDVKKRVDPYQKEINGKTLLRS